MELSGFEPEIKRCQRFVIPFHYNPIQWTRWESNPVFLHAMQACFPSHSRPMFGVELRGVEPRSSACKAEVIPLYHNPIYSTPYGIRTRVCSLRTRCPWPTRRRGHISGRSVILRPLFISHFLYNPNCQRSLKIRGLSPRLKPNGSVLFRTLDPQAPQAGLEPAYRSSRITRS